MDSFNQLADRKGLLSTRHLGALLRMVRGERGRGWGRRRGRRRRRRRRIHIFVQVGENPTTEELQDFVNELDKVNRRTSW